LVSNSEIVDRVPLSLNQEFLCMFDSGDDSGPFGPRYHLMFGWRLTGPVDETALRRALIDVVDRHEALRTRIVRDDGARYQQVFPAGEPPLDLRECPGVAPHERAQRAEAFLNALEAGNVDADELPHLRAVLTRFDSRDAFFALMTHHTAADGWSMRVLARDFVACYAARRGGGEPELPPTRQYRDFVAWERGPAAVASMAAARNYWAGALRGARLTAFRTDHLRSAVQPSVTAGYRFAIAADVASAVTRVATRARCTPFMVLLAAYYRLVHRLTGAADIVVSTNTPGRANGLFDDSVGSFFNFVPLRVQLDRGHGAGDLLRRTRATCLAAYAYDLPSMEVFGAAPELMADALRDDVAPVTFQALPLSGMPQALTAGDLTFTEIRQRNATVPVISQLPEGALWTLSFEESGELSGNLAHRTDRFDHRTITRWVDDYQDVLRDLLDELASAGHAG
jgi:condensation enzyme